MSAEANIQSTQYKPQMVNRAAAASDTKYGDQGGIIRRLPDVSFDTDTSHNHILGTRKRTATTGQNRHLTSNIAERNAPIHGNPDRAQVDSEFQSRIFQPRAIV